MAAGRSGARTHQEEEMKILIADAFDDSLPGRLAAFGEVSLTGHVRPVAHAAARCREAVQLGFPRIAARPSGRDKISSLVEVSGLADALSLLR
jgi:DNA repair protein RadA/Sms